MSQTREALQWRNIQPLQTECWYAAAGGDLFTCFWVSQSPLPPQSSLCCIKIQNGSTFWYRQPRFTWKMAVKMGRERERKRERDRYIQWSMQLCTIRAATAWRYLVRVCCINTKCDCAEQMSDIVVTDNASQVNCPHTDNGQPTQQANAHMTHGIFTYINTAVYSNSIRKWSSVMYKK